MGVQCSELGGSTNIQWISNNGKKRVQFLSSGLGPWEGHARQRQALQEFISIEVGQQQTRPAWTAGTLGHGTWNKDKRW